jgi:hypothetical protein
LISASFSDFAAKSKIPPELIAACFQVGDVVDDGVDAFGFHGVLSLRKAPIIAAR